MIVRITTENIFAFITGTGIKRGVLEKKNKTPKSGIISGWKINEILFNIKSFINSA